MEFVVSSLSGESVEALVDVAGVVVASIAVVAAVVAVGSCSDGDTVELTRRPSGDNIDVDLNEAGLALVVVFEPVVSLS